MKPSIRLPARRWRCRARRRARRRLAPGAASLPRSERVGAGGDGDSGAPGSLAAPSSSSSSESSKSLKWTLSPLPRPRASSSPAGEPTSSASSTSSAQLRRELDPSSMGSARSGHGRRRRRGSRGKNLRCRRELSTSRHQIRAVRGRRGAAARPSEPGRGRTSINIFLLGRGGILAGAVHA